MLGSFDHLTRRLIVHTSPTKRSSDFVAHLEQLDQLYGPKPGQFTKPVVLVLDNGPIHTSKLSLAALASRAHWLTVEWLPKYAPELNDIEAVWRDLKAHHLAHQTFADADALNTAIHQAVDALNLERTPLPLVKLRNQVSTHGKVGEFDALCPRVPRAAHHWAGPPEAYHLTARALAKGEGRGGQQAGDGKGPANTFRP